MTSLNDIDSVDESTLYGHVKAKLNGSIAAGKARTNTPCTVIRRVVYRLITNKLTVLVDREAENLDPSFLECAKKNSQVLDGVLPFTLPLRNLWTCTRPGHSPIGPEILL